MMKTMERIKIKKKFDIVKAKIAARDYAVATGMECLLLTVDQNPFFNDTDDAIQEYLRYIFIKDIAGMCIRNDAKGMAMEKRIEFSQPYYRPMGILQWASPVIIDGRIEAVFMAGQSFSNQSKEGILNLKNIANKHSEQLADYLNLRNSFLQSPIINDERMQGLKKMLDVIARSFSDRDLSEEAFADIRDAFRQSYEFDMPYNQDTAWQNLFNSIRKKDSAAAERALDEVLGKFREATDFQAIRVALAQLILCVYNDSLEKEGQCFLTERCLNALSELERLFSLKEISVWAENSLPAIIETWTLAPSLKNTDLLFKVIQYIEDHYQEKFTLQDIADYVHFTAPYFCKIFKKEIGVTFTRYLTNVRIEKSKQLLKNTDYPLADIPSMVGFEEQSYFTRVFHTTTGVSPGKYRNRNLT